MAHISTLVRTSLPSTARADHGEGGLPRILVESPHASAEIYCQGAHVTSWRPAGEPDALWMSAHSLFAEGTPIRGGIPICFPWFGAHQSDASAPAHGFARTRDWALVSADDRNGDVRLTFELRVEPTAAWPHQATARYHVTVGRTLELSLEVTNSSHAPLTFEEALHTYFSIGDIRSTLVHGFEGVDYLDKVAGFERRTQGAEPVRFEGETDRIYLDHGLPCRIEAPASGRTIRIDKQRSASSIVWNPWIDKARAMPDFGDDEWTGMLCVETGNVRLDPIALDPGATHTMTATIATEPKR